MANSNTPFGLRPVGTIGNASYSGKVQMFYSSTSETAAIGIGDCVVLAGSADANGVPTVIRGTAGGTFVGVCTGVVPDPTDLTKGFKAANTARYLLVDTDPNTIYEVQAGNTSKTTGVAVADVGLNATLVIAATCNTTTGVSDTIIDATTKATTTTLDVQFMRLSPKVGNEVASYGKWLVRLNNNQYKANATGL